jgi:STIMATE family
MFVHGVNILISDVGSACSSGNACIYYFLNILIDTTLGAFTLHSPFLPRCLNLHSTAGVGIIYLTFHLITWLFTDKLRFKGFQPGQYSSPPSLRYWACQTAVYVISLTSMKLLVVLLLTSWHKLLDFGAWLLSWLGTSDTAQVVLCVFPLPPNLLPFRPAAFTKCDLNQ